MPRLSALVAIAILMLLVGCTSGSTKSPGFANPPMPTNPVMPLPTSMPISEAVLETGTPVPSATPAAPEGTPTPIPVIASNGLGARKYAWEKIEGAATTVGPTYQGAGEAVYGANLQVTFDARGVVVSIAKDYKSTALVSLDQARSESVKLIPSDSVPRSHFSHPTTNPQGGGGIEPLVLVDIYNSKALTTIFPPETWPNVGGYVEEPGTFYIQYEEYPSKGNQIGAFLMELSTPP